MFNIIRTFKAAGKTSGDFLSPLKLSFFVLLVCVFLLPAPLFAEDLDSTNFTIYGNSINAGGTRTTSTNFVLESTLGEISGVTTSTNFSSRAGFQALSPEPKITLTLSANSVNLGTLAVDTVSSASITVTVTTNASSGYSVRISEDGNLRNGSDDIDDVTDGSVTAGSEEYGIRTSGTAGQYNSSDTAISGTVTIVSSSSAASAEETTVSFRASMQSTTVNASYSHTVAFTTVANF